MLIRERLATFNPIFGRCSTHFIENGPVFINDASKAPYHSIYLAINMLANFSAPRRRIVIGHIADYAGGPRSKYRDVYRASRLVADQVIFVGDNSHRSMATAEDIAAGRFVEKRSVEEAAIFVRDTAIPGEIILLKSSRSLHLERILLSFEDEVRCWEPGCGRKLSCVRCGSYAIPWPQQVEIDREKKKQRRLKPSRWEGLLVRGLSGIERSAADAADVTQAALRTGTDSSESTNPAVDR